MNSVFSWKRTFESVFIARSIPPGLCNVNNLAGNLFLKRPAHIPPSEFKQEAYQWMPPHLEKRRRSESEDPQSPVPTESSLLHENPRTDRVRGVPRLSWCERCPGVSGLSVINKFGSINKPASLLRLRQARQAEICASCFHGLFCKPWISN